jgi:GNAT superfamily N-acetyltransferase
VNISVRPAAESDVDVIADLNASVQDLHVEHEPGFFKSADIGEVRLWFADFLAGPGNRAWLAYDAAVPIGYATVEVKRRQNSPFSPERRWFEVDQVVVLSPYRRRGVATALLKEVLSAAIAEGVDDLELSTWHFNSGAVQAFSKLGFRPTKQRFAFNVRDRRK